MIKDILNKLNLKIGKRKTIDNIYLLKDCNMILSFESCEIACGGIDELFIFNLDDPLYISKIDLNKISGFNYNYKKNELNLFL